MVHQCFDLKTVILGRDRYELSHPKDNESARSLGESLAFYIDELRNQRNVAMEKINSLERECEGLRLSITRNNPHIPPPVISINIDDKALRKFKGDRVELRQWLHDTIDTERKLILARECYHI